MRPPLTNASFFRHFVRAQDIKLAWNQNHLKILREFDLKYSKNQSLNYERRITQIIDSRGNRTQTLTCNDDSLSYSFKGNALHSWLCFLLEEHVVLQKDTSVLALVLFKI